MLDFLKSLDTILLLKINGAHTPFWDTIMIACTNKFFWFPFYAILLGFLIYKYKIKSVFLFIAIALLITTSDQFASTLMKPIFARLRPCHDPSLSGILYLVKGCGGLYGFISSHAANTFAIASLLSFLFKNWKTTGLLISWAFVVSISIVYLGAHYPGDILFGGIAGIFFGWVYYRIFYLFIDKYFPEESLNLRILKTS